MDRLIMTKCGSKFGAMAVTMATVHHKPVTSQLIRGLRQNRRPELSQKTTTETGLKHATVRSPTQTDAG